MDGGPSSLYRCGENMAKFAASEVLFPHSSNRSRNEFRLIQCIEELVLD